jgi:hypothetical protein
VFAPLPPEWQTRGGDLQAKLDWVPHGKWQSLDDVARDLGAEGTSPDQLRAESDAFVALVRQLKENVDGIVTDLAKPEAQQSPYSSAAPRSPTGGTSVASVFRSNLRLSPRAI